MKNIVLFGPPGAGKGTQAEIIKQEYDLFHISTGDVFRYNIKNNTDLGLLAKGFMDKGELVPDQITIDMLSDVVEKNSHVNGFIFDGFPRTIYQANEMNKILNFCFEKNKITREEIIKLVNLYDEENYFELVICCYLQLE